MVGSTLQYVGWIGTGALSSALFCSLFLFSSGREEVAPVSLAPPPLADAETTGSGEMIEPPFGETGRPPPSRPSHVATVMPLPSGEGSAGGFLVELLSDEDPAVRSTAVWLLTSSGDSGELQQEIVASLRKERDPTIRTHLYRALHGRKGLDCHTVLELALDEPDPEAKITGFDLLAALLAESGNPATREAFNQRVVPELTSAALGTGHGMPVRLTAVMALQRAQTREAGLALEHIAQHSIDPRVKEAARAAAAGTRADR